MGKHKLVALMGRQTIYPDPEIRFPPLLVLNGMRAGTLCVRVRERAAYGAFKTRLPAFV